MTSMAAAVSELRRAGDLFSPQAPVYVARAPGRLDLMGGNVDYTGGLVLQATVREATEAAVQPREDGRFVFSNPQLRECGWRDRAEFTLEDLASEERVRAAVGADPGMRWTAYAFGVFFYLRRHYPRAVRYGANVFIRSTIPMNKGVSSSAAIEVAVMSAAAEAYRIDLRGVALALACQWVENVIAGAGCGIMDQAAVVLGGERRLLPLLCQPCVPLPLIPLPAGLEIWGVDSGVSHAVSGIEYESVRAASFMGYRMICGWESIPLQLDESGVVARWVDSRWNGYLSDVPASVFREHYERRLPEEVAGGEFIREFATHADPYSRVLPEQRYRVRACTRYSIEENLRIRLFVELAKSQSESAWPLMGELMYQSHWSYTECGLGCAATDRLVELAREEGAENGLFGAKVSGGGAGGTVVILGRQDAWAAVERVAARYAAGNGGVAPCVFEGSSPGADRTGVTVIR